MSVVLAVAVGVAGAQGSRGSEGINSSNSNSEPGQRTGTHEWGSGWLLRSLTWGQGDRVGGRTVNPMPRLSRKFHLIRLLCSEKGLCIPMQGRWRSTSRRSPPNRPDNDTPLRDRNVICAASLA